MKDYKLSDYPNFIAAKNAIVADLNAELQDVEFTSNRFTDCEILEVVKATEFNGKQDFIVEVSVLGGIKQFCIRPSLENGTISLSVDKLAIVNEMLSKLDSIASEYYTKVEAEKKDLAARSEAAYRELLAKQARLKAKAAELEEQDKLEAKIKRSQKKFEEKIKAYVKIGKDPIEWLKENTVSVTAVIPDHLEKLFIKQFGDVPHTIVNASRKTSGGFSMKFAESFTLTVKKDAIIPGELTPLFKGNKLCNTSFIAKLIRDDVVSFGKIDKVK